MTDLTQAILETGALFSIWLAAMLLLRPRERSKGETAPPSFHH